MEVNIHPTHLPDGSSCLHAQTGVRVPFRDDWVGLIVAMQGHRQVSNGLKKAGMPKYMRRKLEAEEEEKAMSRTQGEENEEKKKEEDAMAISYQDISGEWQQHKL